MRLVSFLLFSQFILISNSFSQKTISFDGFESLDTNIVKNFPIGDSFNSWIAKGFHMDIINVYKRSFYVPPHSGKSMARMFYCSHCPNQYMSCASTLYRKLRIPLEIGQAYKISCWVYLPSGGVELSFYESIGMFLSHEFEPIKVHQILKPNNFLRSKLEPDHWQLLEYRICPLCDLSHLYIGCFQTDSFPYNHEVNFGNHYHFYVDDFKIEKLEESSTIDTSLTYVCPYPIQKERTRFNKDTISVYFNVNDTIISDAFKSEIDSFLKNNRGKNLVYQIDGFADPIGDDLDNYELSKRRANSIRNYLIQSSKYPQYYFRESAKGEYYNVIKNKTSHSEQRRVDLYLNDMRIDQNLYEIILKNIHDAKKIEALTFIKRWINLVGVDNAIFILFDQRITNTFNDKQKVDIIKEIKNQYRKFKEPDKAYCWDSIYCEDQKYRNMDGYLSELAFNQATNFYDCELSRLKHYDSILLKGIKKFLSPKFIPKLTQVRNRPSRAFYNFLAHIEDTALIANILPHIEKLCKEGEALWYYYALLTDKLLVLKVQNQLYGTQMIRSNNSDQEYILAPYDDLKLMNERRVKIGLSLITGLENKIRLIKIGK